MRFALGPNAVSRNWRTRTKSSAAVLPCFLWSAAFVTIVFPSHSWPHVVSGAIASKHRTGRFCLYLLPFLSFVLDRPMLCTGSAFKAAWRNYQRRSAGNTSSHLSCAHFLPFPRCVLSLKASLTPSIPSSVDWLRRSHSRTRSNQTWMNQSSRLSSRQKSKVRLSVLIRRSLLVACV
jgi:hypothetical protein